MSRKRGAVHQLTDQNWDQEEPDNASDDEVQEEYPVVKTERKIKKAVRRSGKMAAQGGSAVNPFQSFGGFTGFGGLSSSNPPKPILPTTKPISVAPSTTSGPSVDFWKGAKMDGPFFNPSSVTKTAEGSMKDTASQPFSFSTKKTGSSLTTATTSLKDSEPKTLPNGQFQNRSLFNSIATTNLPQASSVSPSNSSRSQYSEQIVDLNLSVLAWIKQHIDDNPCIDLTPVFRDYESYMADIDKKYGPEKGLQGSEEARDPIKSSQESPVTAPVTSKVGLFSSPSEKLKAPDPDLVTGASPKGPSLFSTLATSTPLPQPKGAEDSTKTEGDDNSDEPPKGERKTVVEEDAFHTVRCKLFFKKGEGWQDLGVGMLYLKPLDKKTQLLVRMETATGKILLNVGLDSSVPVLRTGKNNVTLVSLPNPPVFSKPAEGDNSKPVTYLIRVKGEAEADNLFEKVNECKGKDSS